MMTPRERVLAFLRREIPDRVPWVELGVDDRLQARIMGVSGFEPPDLCRKLGLDGFGGTINGGVIAEQQGIRGRGIGTGADTDDRVSLSFEPPWIAEFGFAEATGRSFIKRGLLTSRDSLKLFEGYLPDPDDPARFAAVARWLACHKGEFATFALIRLGSSSTLESMGLDVFSYMMYDDPDLVHEVHERFSAWSARVVRHLNELDFDFYWAADDVAGSNGPFVSPKAFREFFLPHMRTVVREIEKPWIFHSDGDISPLLPDLLSLGMNAIHPIQPSVMDLGRVKREYGDRVGIVGNIDLDYTLTRGTPEEVEFEVKQKIGIAGPGGGYMVSSANSLTDYCKVENVWAMARAVEKYGYYPLRVD